MNQGQALGAMVGLAIGDAKVRQLNLGLEASLPLLLVFVTGGPLNLRQASGQTTRQWHCV